MEIRQSRRDFLASTSLAAAAGVLGARGSLADEKPLETTSVRLTTAAGICIAPQYLAGELLRADGFADVRFVPAMKGPAGARMIGRGEADFTSTFAASIVLPIDEGERITVLAGVHRGCYELFATERIRTIADLKGKRVGIPALRSSPHLYLSVMAKHIGLDPEQDIHWITSREVDPMELFAAGEIDAFLGFPPEPQILRARGIGRPGAADGGRVLGLGHVARGPPIGSAVGMGLGTRARRSAPCRGGVLPARLFLVSWLQGTSLPAKRLEADFPNHTSRRPFADATFFSRPDTNVADREMAQCKLP